MGWQCWLFSLWECIFLSIAYVCPTPLKKVSLTFYIVISFHFTVVACLLLYTHVSPNPCTSTPVILCCLFSVKILRVPAELTAPKFSPKPNPPLENCTPSCNQSCWALSLSSSFIPSCCTWVHFPHHQFPLPAQRSSQWGKRASLSNFSPFSPGLAYRQAAALVGIRDLQHCEARWGYLIFRWVFSKSLQSITRCIPNREQGFVRSRAASHSYCSADLWRRRLPFMLRELHVKEVPGIVSAKVKHHCIRPHTPHFSENQEVANERWCWLFNLFPGISGG